MAPAIRISALMLLALWLISCVEFSGYGPQGPDPSLPNLSHPGIWIANEGAFTQGQASLSFYDRLEDTVYNNVFRAVNNRPVGDVLQSVSYYDSRAFLVVNNSRKIEVVDSITFEHLYTISGLSSPRQLVGHNGRLFITDLYSDRIEVLDADSYEQVTTIETGGWTEDMLLHNGKLYVTVQQLFINNTSGSAKGLLVLDVNALDAVGFVDLPQGANSLTLDADDQLWVLCDGGLEEEIGGLFRIDPVSLLIERSIHFPSVVYSASRLQAGSSGEQLYFILSDPENGLNAYDIYRMNLSEDELPSTPFIDGGGLYIYGLLIDDAHGQLFYTDAVGLIQEGFLYRHDLVSGQLSEIYLAGIFPSELSFR